MLISSPFLPQRLPTESDDGYLDRVMATGGLGEGAFPLSYEMSWHGGIHLQAPRAGSKVEPVRAIADGTVTFLRQPTKRSADPKHPLNYRGGWTDDGCVVLKHTTTIGYDAAHSRETEVVFYSVYMHLQSISAPPVGKDTFRKEPIGAAGSLYGAANRLHLEVVCDDANLKNLVGRTSAYNPVNANGRTDAIFGAIWFLILVNTPFYGTEPQPGKPLPPVVFQNTTALFVEMRFEGADAIFVTHALGGATVGSPVRVPHHGYDVVDVAMKRYPASPSAALELMRFGRVIGPDALSPQNAPLYRQIALPSGGTGWVDLDAPRVRRFSDADFPFWVGDAKHGWVVVDAGSSADSRCKDVGVAELLDVDADLTVDPEEAKARLGDPVTQRGLAHKICKFPTEWEAATVDKRYAWLKTEKKPKLTAAEFARFSEHAKALCFWVGNQPGIAAVHWHFHPREFIRQFKKCNWLSERELVQCAARKHLYLSNTAFAPITKSWSSAKATLSPWHIGLMTKMRRYGVSHTPQRMAHFLAQVFEETGFFKYVVEIGGSSRPYAPWYGRGLIQLTTLDNYKNYGEFRGFGTPPLTTGPYAPLGWDPDDLIARTDTVYDANNCVDTAGFYWAKNRSDNGLRRSDGGLSLADITSTCKYVNGNVPNEKVNGLEVRIGLFVYMKYVLTDLLPPGPHETVTFVWRSDSKQHQERDAAGNLVWKDPPANTKPKMAPFVANTWTVHMPLDPQRP